MIGFPAAKPPPAPPGTPPSVAGPVYAQCRAWHDIEERILRHLALETARRGPWDAALLLFAPHEPQSTQESL